MKTAMKVGVLATAAVCCAFADASYSETVHYEGGSLVEMMHNMANGPMGRMAGQAFQDQTFAVYVKGNKMARIGTNTSTITDLDAGTITNINNLRKTYTVISFDEMKQMQGRMRGGDTNVDFNVKVDKTGKTKEIDGQTATEYVISMTAKDSGSEGGMKINSHVWLIPSEPGAVEVRAFYKKMATQNKSALGGGGGPMMSGASQGLAAAAAQLAAMDGVAVETHMEMSGISMPMGPMAQGAGDPNAPALIMATQNSSYATGAVDDSKFAIPAGYKKTERGMGMGRRPGPPPPQDQ